MKRRFILAPAATRDLIVIQDYLMLHAGVKPARKISRQLREAIELLAGMPWAGHVREDLTFKHVRFWPVGPYLIVYDGDASPIEIVRVLDGRRDVAEILIS